MNTERIRLYAETVGIAALVISIAFVGYELKQTRDMNLAEMQQTRLAAHQANMLALLESESGLAYFGKHMYSEAKGVTWSDPELDEIQRAAALVHAEAWLIVWEMEHRMIEQGFSIRTFNDLESEVMSTVAGSPTFKAVWPLWRYPGSEANGFFRMMNRVLADT